MTVQPAVLLIAFGCCAAAHGQIQGPPILDNHYNLDLRQGPILGSARRVALGGAYLGVAEGITALDSNPAGVAFRPERSTTAFDWDWTLGLNDLKSQDFDNNGQSPPDYRSHRRRSLGYMAQYGSWGVGLLNHAEILALEGPSGDQGDYVLGTTFLALGRQVLDRELTLGVGLRLTGIRLRSEPFDLSLGKLSGLGWDLGAVWTPDRGPYRLGVSYASAIRTDQSLDTSGGVPVTVNGLIVPQQAILPATFGIGASYQTPSAPFWPGHAWLVAGDLVFTGTSENAVGVESVLAQRKQPVGTHPTTSLRLGSELETTPGRLRLRLGSYFEPPNFEGVQGRTHLTGGFEVRLFHTSLWGEYDWNLSCTFDTARDYQNLLLAIGFWYD